VTEVVPALVPAPRQSAPSVLEGGGSDSGASIWTIRPAFVAALVLAMAGVCALLLAWPGQTVTTKYVNDLFVFLDGAHRIIAGQLPNRDFHTALGPLAFYVPAAGYWLSGSLGGAMPVGMALAILVLAPAAAHVVSSRLQPALAVPTAAFLLLVAAVPMNLGEGIGALSFAMFYNRFGWAVLGFLLIMYLPPRQPRPGQNLLDTACAALFVFLMLYMKISYGLVGLAFLMFMVLDSGQRGWAVAALAMVLAGGLAVEAVWGSSATYVSDLILAGRVSGNLGSLDQLANVLFRNFADYVLFLLFMGLALSRTRRVRDLLFFGFCAASGFMLIKQNFQSWGVVTLSAGAAVAAEIMMRAERPSADGRVWSMAAGAPLLLLALILPPMVHNAAALGLHAGVASMGRGQTFPLPNFDRIKLVKLWTEGEYPAFTKYLATLQNGAEALASLGAKPGRVLVLDFVNPFSAGLGLNPPQGDSPWYHWDRTLNEANFLPAEELFRDVQVVMDPKWAVEAWTADGLRRVYADYLAQNYQLAQETADWKVYVPRQWPSEAASRSVEPGSNKPVEGQPRG
jgi:hypothetical protein